MTVNQEIEPPKVTKPIQLLAAWLVGLIIVNGSFLGAAVSLASSWERTALIIAAIVNVPLFLYAMFVLQTKFRPELQEDVFYSQYLDKKTNKVVMVSREDKLEVELSSIRNQIAALGALASSGGTSGEKHTARKSLGHLWKVAINDYLDNFEEIRSLLKKENIRVSGFFGSAYTKERPTHKVLALSRRMDLESKIEIIMLAQKMGLEAYTYLT